jgi:hypothetical protein
MGKQFFNNATIGIENPNESQIKQHDGFRSKYHGTLEEVSPKIPAWNMVRIIQTEQRYASASVNYSEVFETLF